MNNVEVEVSTRKTMSGELRLWGHFATTLHWYIIGIILVLIYLIVRVELLASNLSKVAWHLNKEKRKHVDIDSISGSPSGLIGFIIAVIIFVGIIFIIGFFSS